jgi:glycosyltransferase involved in cell wall biosynthesis
MAEADRTTSPVAVSERRPATPLVSLLVPVFNEEESIDLFIEATSRVMERAGLPCEFVFVNDGSSDGTLPRLIERSRGDPRVRVVSLSRNFGKEAALTAGLDHARGDVVVPMDVDLQDPPELIPRFLERWREGYDVVYGVRASRASDTTSKRMTAGWFYRLFNRLSQTRIPENAGDFRLIDRRAADVLRGLPERNRFMKGLFAWVGFRSVGVPYERAPRAAGTTKWNYWRLWNFAIDGLVSFSTVPLRVWTYVGALVALCSFLYALIIVARVILFGIDVPGYASLMTVVLFIGGVQLLSLGVIGEYLGRLFVEVKGRPVYVVDGVYEQGKALPVSDTAGRK